MKLSRTGIPRSSTGCRAQARLGAMEIGTQLGDDGSGRLSWKRPADSRAAHLWRRRNVVAAAFPIAAKLPTASPRYD